MISNIRIIGVETNGHISFDETYYDFREAYETLLDKGRLKDDALEMAIIESSEGFSREVDEKYNITTDGIGNYELFENEYENYKVSEEDYRTAIEEYSNTYSIDINDDYPDIEEVLERHHERTLDRNPKYDYNLTYCETKEDVYDIFEAMSRLEVAQEGDDILETYKEIPNWEYPLLIAEPQTQEQIYIYNIDESSRLTYDLDTFLNNLEYGDSYSIEFTKEW